VSRYLLDVFLRSDCFEKSRKIPESVVQFAIQTDFRMIIAISLAWNAFPRVDRISHEKWFTLLTLRSLCVVLALETITQSVNSGTIAVSVALTRQRTVGPHVT
jgi:hypothetical protein